MSSFSKQKYRQKLTKRNQQSMSLGACAIFGDSTANGINEKRLPQKQCNNKAFHFSRAQIEDNNHYLILYAGNNDSTINTSKKTADDLLMLESNVSKTLPSCINVLPKPIVWYDAGKANLTISNINKHLPALQSECIENDNMSEHHFGQKVLHINPKGKGRLALKFRKQIRKF